MLLTGNIGKHGAGVHTWAGNYKGALLQASPWSGPGVGSYTAEDPFHPVLDEKARITHEHLRHTSDGEDPSYWACGEKILAAETREGRKVFTGKTHLPTPTKALWYNNANFLNQAKWIYNIIVNILPKMDLIVDQQIEWTGSAEYADVVLPVNSWVEFQDLEMRRLVLEPVPPGLEGGHQAGPRLARRWRGLRRRGPGARRPDRRPAVRRLLQVHHREEGQGLPPARPRQLHDHAGHGRAVPGRSADGRGIRRRAGGGPDALPHLPARAVLGAGPRLDPVLHRQRPAGQLLPTSPRRSSTARTWSCIARRSRPRPTCPT